MIELSTIDKNLILSAMHFEKDTLSEKEYAQENFEDIDEIIQEFEKQKVTLSRKQLDLIIEYLDLLHCKKHDYDHLKLTELIQKLKEWNELP